MKDKIITLQDNKEYYILEELDYENNKYVLCSQCDLKTDSINENELSLFKINLKDDNLIINDVPDDNLANLVTNKILEKIRNS